MKTKFIIFTWLFAIGLFSPVLLKAQEAPPTNAKVISITTTENATVNISLEVIGVNTSVWIETSPGNFIKKSINGNDTSDYTVSGTSLKIYGDINSFDCSSNGTKITALDVSQNTALTWLFCDSNNLSTLDVSQNTALTWLFCYSNNLSTLDVSQNTALIRLFCNNNKLTALNVANGNNANFLGNYNNSYTAFDATGNSNLKCIQIDENFTPPTTGGSKWLKDDTANWGTNCNTSTNDIENQSSVKVYPNPAKDFVNISGLSDGKLTKIEVFGISGEKVMELSTSQTQVRVNLGTLSTGTYVIRISNEEQNQSFKLIKK